MAVMFSWTDVVLLVFVGIFALLGWKAGMVKMAFRFLSFGVSLLLAWMLYPMLSKVLWGTSLYQAIYSAAAEQMIGADALSSLPEGIRQLVEAGSQNIQGTLASYFAGLAINVISFVLILFGSRLVLWIAERLLRLFTSLPVVGFLNHLAGLAVGILEGLALACVILALLYIVPPLRNHSSVSYAVEESMAVKVLYHENPILRLVLPEDTEDGGFRNEEKK